MLCVCDLENPLLGLVTLFEIKKPAMTWRVLEWDAITMIADKETPSAIGTYSKMVVQPPIYALNCARQSV